LQSAAPYQNGAATRKTVAASIFGGSSEIQRDIVAKMVRGL
jgi:hypothetical protein